MAYNRFKRDACCPRLSAKIDNMLVSLMRIAPNKSSLCISCEEFKYSKSFVARARLLQIQMDAACLCRSRALAAIDFECLNSSHDMQRLDLLETRHFPRQAGKMRFAFGEQPWPTTGSKRDACCPRLSAKIDNMLVSLMRIAPKAAPPWLPRSPGSCQNTPHGAHNARPAWRRVAAPGHGCSTVPGHRAQTP